MALLHIIQDAHTQIGLEGVTPSTAIGNPDVNVQRLVAFANRVGRDLATRAPWTALRAVRGFIALPQEVQTGAVPADCHRIIPDTFWDSTNLVNIGGPLAPIDYEQLKAQFSATSQTACYYTRQGNNLLLWPSPSGGERMSFAYQSLAFCESNAGVPQVSWQADTDTARFSEELFTLGVIALFFTMDQQPTAAAATFAYERRLAIASRADAGMSSTAAVDDFFGGGRRRSTGNLLDNAGPGSLGGYGGGNFIELEG